MSGNINQYKYDEMANKVLRTDKRLLDDKFSKTNIDTNPQSIVGKISTKDLGSNLTRNKNAIDDEEKVRREIEDFEKRQVKSKKNNARTASKSKTLLDSSSVETLNYTPTTESNLHIYGLVLTWCSNQLDNDVPGDVVNSLADIIIEILKSDSTNDLVKKIEVEEVIKTKLPNESFQEVFDLVKNISDYVTQNFEYDEEGIGIVIDSEDEENEAENFTNENGGNNYANDSDQNSLISHESDNEPIGEDNFENDDVVTLINDSSEAQKGLYLDIRSIDKFWLTRKIASYGENVDSYKHTDISKSIFIFLENLVNGKIDIRTFKHDLLEIPDFETNKLISILIENYHKIFFGIKLASTSNTDEKTTIIEQMKKLDLHNLVDEINGKHHLKYDEDSIDFKRQKISPTERQLEMSNRLKTPRFIDINNLVFTQGSRLMTTSKFQLPKGSFKRARKSWEEIHIPPPKKPDLEDSEVIINISELPDWAQTVFPSNETKSLNRIQSKVYPSAFKDDCNILMCAPTGGGKTNVAMLAVLRTLSNFMDSGGHVQLNSFKIVYIAPLKALVQEQVREFERRLRHFGIIVNELTGDSNLTKHQIASTQILVTTPEKWDVITRKNNDASYINLVRLIIIDEIHLLHDERGPVIESIVARTFKNMDDNNENPVRFVGLSATLPNYKDVAKFLRVSEDKGLFYFGASYRPCPLAQQFVGITEKKSFKKYEAMNLVCYEKVVDNVSNNHQVIIFVHSRKETEKTAKWLADKLVETEQINEIMKFSAGVKEILRSESESAKNSGLKNVIPMGFGIHHAGMTKEDRQTSEDLFAQGHIKVLVSTATLAWGVNLPAHTVIIKGTSVYSPQNGTWVDLSPQDILQMLGRAGRPRYDTHGEGIIITSQDEVKYYLAILNQQLPIESQLYSKISDSINAEIVSGAITSLNDCVNWLGYTYLYVRMLHSRSIYHVGAEYDNDPNLIERRKDLGYSALTCLAKNGLIKYNFDRDLIIPTDLGKIASYYYISYNSIRSYDIQLSPYFSEIELFRVFATSEEFKYIPIRQEEKIELQKLMEKAPIPINESVESPLAKVNVLLQAYVSKLKLDGFAMMADMVYIVQSAARLFRAMYELVLRKGWAKLARVLLDLCKMIEKRLWLTNSPLRQFPNVPKEIIQVAERSLTSWKHYLALDDQFQVVQAFKAERFGNLAWELLQKFPQLFIDYSIQPITPSLMKIELEVTPRWKWDISIHGYSESFTLLVEDCDSQKLLFVDSFIVKKKYIGEVHIISFTAPIPAVEQPNYFVSLMSDKWLHCETRIPIMLNTLIVPKKFPASTPLLDLPLVSTSELKVKNFENIFPFKYFNKFQSQAFDAIFNASDNVLFCCSKGNGKTVVAELALLKHWKNERGRAVYLSPHQEIINNQLKQWKKNLGSIAGGKVINKLTGDLSNDLKLIAQSHLILCTPEQFDLVSRRWQQRRNVQAIELLIADDCHVVGDGYMGSVYETVLSRMRFVAINLKKSIRIVALGSSIASSKDFSDWLGVSKLNIFDFDSRERVHPIEVKFQRFEISHHPSLIQCMIRPVYTAINSLDKGEGGGKTVVFVPSRKQCVDVSMEFIKRLTSDNLSWLRTDEQSLELYVKKIQDPALAISLKKGIGYYYKNMLQNDKHIVEKLFGVGALSCLLASKETSSWCPSANYVVVLSTQEYEGKEHRYIDYTINDLLEMVGLSRIDEGSVAKALVLTNSSKIEYYKRFLSLSLPVESHMQYFLQDVLLAEISNSLIKNRQDCIDWITYSLFYRRLQLNPSFYGVEDASTNGLSEYLSELIESVLKELSDSKLVELTIDDDIEDDGYERDDTVEIAPLNGCMISAYYNVSFLTMQTLTTGLNNNTRLKRILEIVCSSSEFEYVPIRAHESEILFKIYNSLPVKWSSAESFESPYFKTFILLQAHFSRLNLPPDLTSDLALILSKVINILYAAVDVLSSESYLNAMRVMDLSQMVVQGMWDNENSLKQIPYFDSSMIDRCKKYNVETVYDVMTLEDEDRNAILNSLNEKQVSKVAEFVNKYPNLEISYSLDGDIKIGEPTTITIQIERDEDVDDLEVVSLRYPLKKSENWWIVIGEQSTKQLLGIKKLAITKRSQKLEMSFTISNYGEHRLSIWCVCDSYLDADKQVEINVLDIKGV